MEHKSIQELKASIRIFEEFVNDENVTHYQIDFTVL